MRCQAQCLKSSTVWAARLGVSPLRSFAAPASKIIDEVLAYARGCKVCAIVGDTWLQRSMSCSARRTISVRPSGLGTIELNGVTANYVSITVSNRLRKGLSQMST